MNSRRWDAALDLVVFPAAQAPDSCEVMFRFVHLHLWGEIIVSVAYLRDRTEQNRTEQNRTEQNRTEQNSALWERIELTCVIEHESLKDLKRQSFK